MHRKGLVTGIVWLGLVVGGCDAVDDPGAIDDPDLVDQDGRSEVGNAQVLNSAVLNGIQLNGIQLNGIQLNGIQLNGIQLNGIQLNGIQLNGSKLSAISDDGGGAVTLTGPDLIGAEMLLTTGEIQYTLRFDDVFENPDQPGKDVWFHQISFREGGEGEWTSLCHDPAGAPTEAILMANYWDSQTGARVEADTVVTFACRHAVLAKCVEWGYIPWSTAPYCTGGVSTCAPISLRDHHQACTRMARADYCGDGRSYTFNGTPIDIYDRLSPRLQARSTNGLFGWDVEAEWGPDGATCVGDDLRMSLYDSRQVNYDLPGCLADLGGRSNCGSLPTSRPNSKIANSYCHLWETLGVSVCNLHNDDRN